MKQQKATRNIRRRMATATVAIAALTALVPPNVAHASEVTQKRFALRPNPAFVDCLAAYPGDSTRPPQAIVTVRKGNLNDQLDIQLKNIKPGLAFDLFTVENSSLLADGSPDPEAKSKGFGLAWYQTDLEVQNNYRNVTSIRTVLVDQIFGFDPAVGLAPTNTFHVGFWFNDPAAVESCQSPPPVTPFNGEHHAGPLAMISLPDADTLLGPLCFNPDFSTDPVHCNP